jgi:hypothetical protein
VQLGVHFCGVVLRRCQLLHNEDPKCTIRQIPTIRMVTSRRMRSEGHIARIGENRNVNVILVGKRSTMKT